jgi:hypothetical protein
MLLDMSLTSFSLEATTAWARRSASSRHDAGQRLDIDRDHLVPIVGQFLDRRIPWKLGEKIGLGSLEDRANVDAARDVLDDGAAVDIISDDIGLFAAERPAAGQQAGERRIALAARGRQVRPHGETGLGVVLVGGDEEEVAARGDDGQQHDQDKTDDEQHLGAAARLQIGIDERTRRLVDGPRVARYRLARHHPAQRRDDPRDKRPPRRGLERKFRNFGPSLGFAHIAHRGAMPPFIRMTPPDPLSTPRRAPFATRPERKPGARRSVSDRDIGPRRPPCPAAPRADASVDPALNTCQTLKTRA